MVKVFLDSSILVAASASKTGGSALILDYCRKEKVKGFVSKDVIGEAKKNINLKLGQKEQIRFVYYLKHANLFLTEDPSVEQIAEAEKVIYAKDAPILASAVESKASYLITLDRKHFFTSQVEKFASPMKVVTPKDFILSFR